MSAIGEVFEAQRQRDRVAAEFVKWRDELNRCDQRKKEANAKLASLAKGGPIALWFEGKLYVVTRQYDRDGIVSALITLVKEEDQ